MVVGGYPRTSSTARKRDNQIFQATLSAFLHDNRLENKVPSEKVPETYIQSEKYAESPKIFCES